MTIRLPLTAPTLPDTLEARWDRWVAKRIGQDRIAHKRAIIALMILASMTGLAAAWLLVVE
jgi:predicted secreted Zn-dependent protease